MYIIRSYGSGFTTLIRFSYWILCETVLPGQGDVPRLTEVDFTDTDQTTIVFKYICSLELLLHTMWASGIKFPLLLAASQLIICAQKDYVTIINTIDLFTCALHLNYGVYDRGSPTFHFSRAYFFSEK